MYWNCSEPDLHKSRTHLPDGPGSMGVHGGVWTPGVWELARYFLRYFRHIFLCVHWLDLYALNTKPQQKDKENYA